MGGAKSAVIITRWSCDHTDVQHYRTWSGHCLHQHPHHPCSEQERWWALYLCPYHRAQGTFTLRHQLHTSWDHYNCKHNWYGNTHLKNDVSPPIPPPQTFKSVSTSRLPYRGRLQTVPFKSHVRSPSLPLSLCRLRSSGRWAMATEIQLLHSTAVMTQSLLGGPHVSLPNPLRLPVLIIALSRCRCLHLEFIFLDAVSLLKYPMTVL